MYKLIKTDDGSYSLYSEAYGQAMHSTSGAYDEALRKHVFPSKLLEFQGVLKILDLGFGLGYNSLALIHEAAKNPAIDFIEITALEQTRDFLPYVRQISFSDEREEIYAQIKDGFEQGQIATDKYQINILFGDARTQLLTLPQNYFSAIFHDAFSPAANPELWSADFFEREFALLNSEGVLTTYSAAPQVRGALLAAGFFLARGPAVGPKKQGTLATKNQQGTFEFLPAEEIQSLLANHKSLPYRDPQFGTTRDEMLKKRLIEMKIFREEKKGKSSV